MTITSRIVCSKLRNFRKFIFTNPSRRICSQNIINSDLEDVKIPNVPIDECLFENIEKWPHNIATECASTGRKYTYEQVQKKGTNLSKNLRKKLKLQKGDVIAIILPNLPEYVIVAVGALMAGLVVTTLNPIYNEISRQLKDSAAKVVVTTCDFYPLVKLAAGMAHILSVKTKQSEATPTSAIDISEFLEYVDYGQLEETDPNEIAVLLYSSGTTGLPKGVQLSHTNIVANICQLGSKNMSVIEDTTDGHQDVIPVVVPQFHIHGFVAHTLYLFTKGCKSVTIPKFSPELYLTTLRRHKPHVLPAAPPLASHPSVSSNDLSSVRTITSGAAPLGASDEERLLVKAKKNINILQGYSLTEACAVVTMTRPDLKNLPNSNGTVGRPVSLTSVKIVNPEGVSLGPNETGELLIKGPQVMKGYHNNPVATKDAFTIDGWLRTGDLMYYTSDKLLFVKDRLKELIKVKGFQVAPAELEEIIRNFSDVEDAAVVGVAHPMFGEAPKAYVVAKNGRSIDSKRLEEFVAGRVAPYKKLSGGVELIDKIPKTASGKILRRLLKSY